eukprot:TRINITY_DN5405_c0_g1_i2.p1 TRINITY_DN5405_c0_g1~~TRINITY_DN5405_c0_g1_i2.p1  ORF type:complete len:407 (-),score=68.37 TRINITY_DN5405_c0_g1_i2:120-1340(-)
MNLLILLVGLYLLADLACAIVAWFEINRRPTPQSSKQRLLLPYSVTFYHHVIAYFPVKIAFITRQFVGIAVTAALWLIPSLRLPVTESVVVELILETTLVLHVRKHPPHAADQQEQDPLSPSPNTTSSENTSTTPASLPSAGTSPMATLSMANFAVPFLPGKFDNTVEVTFHLSKKSVATFRFNDTDVSSPAEMLAVVAALIACVSHPMAHSFHNRLYTHNKDRRAAAEFPEIFLHGQSLNNAAHYYPSFYFGTNPAWFQQMLVWNSEQLAVPRHSPSALAELESHSRLVRFCLAARPVVFASVRKHKVPVDPEAFFVCSFVHSLEHYNLGRLTRHRYMEYKALPKRAFSAINCAAYCFFYPIHSWWCNNLLVRHRNKNPFYSDLFDGLESHDLEMLELISLSLAY